jgi:hypothetical protein
MDGPHSATSMGRLLGRHPSRGFLAEAEREAKGIRGIAADELIDLARVHDLERLQAFAFSACTFDIDDPKVIVVNPLRTRARSASDVAHELPTCCSTTSWTRSGA